MRSSRSAVAQVAGFYPPHLGGVEVVAKALADGLAGYRDVRVITTSCGAQGLPHKSLEGHVQVTRYRGKEVAHTPVSPGLAFGLLALPRRTIVHAHIAQALLPELVAWTSRLRRRPFILHFHLDVDSSGPLGRLLPAYKRFMLGPALRLADAVLVLSTEQADFVHNSYGVAEERLHVVPNGVGRDFFDVHVARARGPGDPLRLLFVGRLSAQKNVLRLLNALAMVTAPVEAVIVGDGELRLELEAAVGRLKLGNIRLAGAQYGEDLLSWYAWADAFVLPSDKEGIPLVALEAMAAGLPVLATNVEGTRDLLAGVGLLVPASPQGLADGITALAESPARRSELAEKSRAAARNLSWQTIVEQVDALYDGLGRGK